MAPPVLDREGFSLIGLQPGSGSVVLTYDDGPTPGVTDRLLTILAGTGATATFFVLLTRVRRSPALLRALLDTGHEVGLHGLDHRRLTTVDPESLGDLMRDGRRELEDVSGRPVRWFRPPYGAQNAASWQAARDAGLTPVLWNLHCRDWEDVSMDSRLADLRSGPLEGRILLLHDGYADSTDGVDDGPAPVFDRGVLTTAVLDEARAQELRPCSLGDALEGSDAVAERWYDEG